MTARSRTLRWLAALLILASPGIGGQVLPLVHPCAAAADEGHAHQGPGASHGAGHDPVPDGGQCTCIGNCQPSGLVAAPHPLVSVAVAAPLPVAPLRVGHQTAILPADRPIDRLPPPTAPPLA